MLIYLNHAQSLIIILVENGLDAGGFTGSGITKKQTVIGRPSLHKGLRIVNELLFLNLIAGEIIQHHLIQIVDRHKVKTVLILRDTESFI